MEVVQTYVADAQIYLKKLLPKNEKEWEWWIKLRNPQDIQKHHESYLYCEIAFYVLGFLTFCHAVSSGGRYKWLWFATIAHGLTVECVSYFIPDIDNFWHGQSMVMLIGQRLPLHILLIYPVFIYTAAVAVSHMNLKWWAEPFAVGLSVVLLDVPFDIMGIKLLWWSWHDDDPNIYDRHYWVPWTSYYFHAAFASSFAFIFFNAKKLMCSRALKFQSSGLFLEFPVLLVTGLFSMPLGVLQFIPIYHPMHDSLGIHSEVCVLLFLAFFALIVWCSDRRPYEFSRYKGGSLFSIPMLVVVLHYALYVYLVLTAKPNKVRSTGLHQPVGPCNKAVKVQTPFGHVLKKTHYLCLKNYSEDYFTLDCLKKPPVDKTEWYTICGTHYPNHREYIVVVSAFCILGLFWFFQALCRSGPKPLVEPIKHKKKESKD